MGYDGFTYFAWLVIALLFLAVVVFIVWLGMQPGKIARKRNHPQAAAIEACSWLGLFGGGVGWAIAFVWAYLKSGPVGADEQSSSGDRQVSAEVEKLKRRIAELEKQLAAASEGGGSA